MVTTSNFDITPDVNETNTNQDTIFSRPVNTHLYNSLEHQSLFTHVHVLVLLR